VDAAGGAGGGGGGAGGQTARDAGSDGAPGDATPGRADGGGDARAGGGSDARAADGGTTPRPDGGGSGDKSKNWVFLMLGQSNMSGTSPIEAQDRIAPPRVFKMVVNRTWAPGTEGFGINPFGPPSGGPSGVGSLSLSPSRVFAMKLLEQVTDPEVNIYIVNAAVSGSNIESWNPQGGANFRTMLPYLEEGLKKGVLKGFLWHQGEANGGTAPAEYAMRLRAIVKEIRDQVRDPMLPVVAGEVGTTSDDGNVNRALAMIASADPRFVVATSENLTLHDNVHYSSASIRTFGERYAAAMAKLLLGR
jgi:hypothetical protein